MSIFNTPILFLVFNRPGPTQRVFQCVRKIRPSRLYIAADGPRRNCPKEKEKCKEVRAIATDVDWDCEVKTLFREENLGCRIAVSTAIDWFFENEPEGIILEDDCLPDQSFFIFCEELLQRYRKNERVMVISGNYFHGDYLLPSCSYFFSRYNHCWGWASWRRAWQHYEPKMSSWPRLRGTDWLINLGDGHRDFQRCWSRIFDIAKEGKVDSWAYRWTFSCWVQDGLSVLPYKNLVKNIGFGEDSTHTKGDGKWIGKIPLETMPLPLVHPREIEPNKIADRWTDLNVFNTKKRLLKKVVSKIKDLLNYR